MYKKHSYLGNSIVLDNSFATLECIDENKMENIPFIAQGFKPILFAKDLNSTYFKLLNKTNYSILVGSYDHRIWLNAKSICSIAERFEIAPKKSILIRIPTMKFGDQIQFYTVSSQSQSVLATSHIPSSVDEYIPFNLVDENNSIGSSNHDFKVRPILHFQNFEAIKIKMVPDKQFCINEVVRINI